VGQLDKSHPEAQHIKISCFLDVRMIPYVNIRACNQEVEGLFNLLVECRSEETTGKK
jgi:hypothetical protein